MNLTELKEELEIILSKNEKLEKNIAFDLLEKYNSDDWNDYNFFDEKNYKRNYFYKSELFDIIIICWKQGQATSLHGHPEKGCYFKLLEGILQEDLYPPKSDKIKINILNKNQITYEHNSIGKHIVSNNSEKNAVGLYIYQSAGDYNPNK